MKITVTVCGIQVPVSTEDETIVVAVDGVDVLGIDLAGIETVGEVTIGSWPDGENWVTATTITARPSIRYRCSECGGIDASHRFMPCEGGTWEPIQ